MVIMKVWMKAKVSGIASCDVSWWGKWGVERERTRCKVRVEHCNIQYWLLHRMTKSDFGTEEHHVLDASNQEIGLDRRYKKTTQGLEKHE